MRHCCNHAIAPRIPCSSILSVNARDRDPTRAMKILRYCAILNRPSIAPVGMIFCEQTSGEGCSDKRPQPERVGAFCFGKKIYYLGSSLTSSGITARSPKFQEVCNSGQTPNTAWCNFPGIAMAQGTCPALPHSAFCSWGAKGRYGHGRDCSAGGAVTKRLRHLFYSLCCFSQNGKL